MSTQENKELVRRWYNDWSQGNMEALYAPLAPDIVDHNPVPGQAPGLRGVKEALEMFHTAFPDMRITVDSLIAEADKVVDQITLSGTHTGPLMGIPPTGKRATITASNIWRISNGKCTEIWHIEDMLRLMQQLGVVSMPQQANK